MIGFHTYADAGKPYQRREACTKRAEELIEEMEHYREIWREALKLNSILIKMRHLNPTESDLWALMQAYEDLIYRAAKDLQEEIKDEGILVSMFPNNREALIKGAL